MYYDYMSSNGSTVFMAGFRDIQMLKKRSNTVTFFPTLTARTLEGLKNQIQNIVDNNKGYRADIFMALVLPNSFDLEVDGMDLRRTIDNETYSGKVFVEYLVSSLYQRIQKKTFYTAAIVLTNIK